MQLNEEMKVVPPREEISVEYHLVLTRRTRYRGAASEFAEVGKKEDGSPEYKNIVIVRDREETTEIGRFSSAGVPDILALSRIMVKASKK